MGKLANEIIEDRAAATSRVVEVPEWERTIYVFPLTLGQLEAIENEVSRYRKSARAIVVRAKNADGSPMFDEDDFQKMITHSGSGRFTLPIIGRINQEIMADLDLRDPDVINEEIEGN